MKSFQDILQNNGEEFVCDLMNNYLLVYEKLNASTLSFKRIGEELHFYKGRDTEEITDINSTLYSYFQDGIDYIKRVSLIFFREFPEGWMFKMQYFIDNKTNLIEYEYLPQNNLVLSCIDNGSTLIEDPDILKRWAERLQIDYSQPIFQGFLSEFQKEKINDFINGKVNIGEVSFSKYMMTVLNPTSTHSAYRSNFDGGVDSFIFKFYKPNSKKSICAKIVDPYMSALIAQHKDEFGDNCGCESEIILANFIAYLQTIDLNEIKAEGDTDEERYMDVICKLFNQYIEKEQKLFKDIKSDVNESFNVNLDKIKNKETAELLKNNPNLTTAFQVIVGNFAQHKNPNSVNPLSLINSDLINVFNKEVNKIKSISSTEEKKTKTFDELINAELGKDIETAAKESGDEKIMSFTELMSKIGVNLDGQEDDVKEEPKEESEPETEDQKTEIAKEETHKEEGGEEKKESENSSNESSSSESSEGGKEKSDNKGIEGKAEEKSAEEKSKGEEKSDENEESEGEAEGESEKEEKSDENEESEGEAEGESEKEEKSDENEESEGEAEGESEEEEKSDENEDSEGEAEEESEGEEKSDENEDSEGEAEEESKGEEKSDEKKSEEDESKEDEKKSKNDKDKDDDNKDTPNDSDDTNSENDTKNDKDKGSNDDESNDKVEKPTSNEDSEPKKLETKEKDEHEVSEKPEEKHIAPTPTHDDSTQEKKEMPKKEKPKEEHEAPKPKPAPKSKPQPNASKAPSSPEPQITI